MSNCLNYLQNKYIKQITQNDKVNIQNVNVIYEGTYKRKHKYKVIINDHTIYLLLNKYVIDRDLEREITYIISRG